MQHLISWWRYVVPNQPAKFIAGFAAFLVIALLLVAANLSPYKAPPSAGPALFYQTAETTGGTMVRVEVKSIDKSEGKLDIVPLEGQFKNRPAEVDIRSDLAAQVQPGDTMLVWQSYEEGLNDAVSDFWRLGGVLILVAMLIVGVFIVSGYRGLMGLYGLFFSLGVIVLGIIPAVADGHNAFMVSILAAFVIASISMLVSHGLGRRARVAVIAIYFALITVVLLTLLGDWLGKLTGVYDETSSLLSYGNRQFDLHGILLGGIVIATLGLLDDIVITQVASVEQISKANPKLNTFQLFKRGLSVGNSHIASLINTLALAYAGASLPSILALTYSSTDGHLLEVLNGEFFAQEIVRTVVSSLALVLAVPIATFLASRVYSQPPSKQAILDIFRLRRVTNGSSRDTSGSKR